MNLADGRVINLNVDQPAKHSYDAILDTWQDGCTKCGFESKTRDAFKVHRSRCKIEK